MSTDLMNVAAFKGMAPAAAFAAALNPQSESLADGIGSSYGIIGYKGKVWTLRLRGETYTFVRPDDGSPAAFLDVIVLRQLPNKSKSYYPANTYTDGAIGTRPVCAALDGVAPDADIVTPQATACALCPKNVFKISPDGKKTRECSDYKRLAVLILPSMTKALLGAALMEPVFLRVPAASLNDLALLGEGMSAQGFHFSSYVTRIGFNPEKPHPQMTFRALQALTDREAPVVLPLRDDPTAIRITGEGEIGRPKPVAVAAPAPATAAVQPVAATVAPVAAPVVAPAPVGPVDTGFGGAPAAPVTAPVTPATAPAPAPAPAVVAQPAAPTTVDTGFGDIGGGAPATAAPTLAPTVNTVADTGEPEPADADLDARVMALLPKKA